MKKTVICLVMAAWFVNIFTKPVNCIAEYGANLLKDTAQLMVCVVNNVTNPEA